MRTTKVKIGAGLAFAVAAVTTGILFAPVAQAGTDDAVDSTKPPSSDNIIWHPNYFQCVYSGNAMVGTGDASAYQCLPAAENPNNNPDLPYLLHLAR